MSIASRAGASTKNIVGTRFVLSVLAGGVMAYFLTGFFSNVFPQPYQFVLLSLLFQFLSTTVIFLLLAEAPQASERVDPLGILTLVLGLALSIAAVMLAWQFPGLFNRRLLFMDVNRLPLFIVTALISSMLSVLLLKKRQGFFEQLQQSQIFRFTRANIPGLLLALSFFVG